MTNQPNWKCIANLSDLHPVDHGGFFVLIDTTGHYAPEAEMIETPVDHLWGAWNEETEDTGGWHPEARWTCYRWSLEPHTYQEGVLSDNKFHQDIEVWYGDKLQEVADYVDCTVSDLIDAFIGDDPIEKAEAYRALVSYFGPHEFDSYPDEFSYQWVKERTGHYLKDLKG